MSRSGAALAEEGVGAARSALIGESTSRVRPFDLRRQETIERARLRRLQPMLETVCHRIGGSLSQAVRQPVRVELASLEQLPWEEYAAGLPDPTFLSSAVLLPLEGRVVLHLPTALVLTLVDHHLGGDGVNEPERAQLTEIERSLAGSLVDGLWGEVPEPFSSFLPLNPAMVTSSSSALLVRVGRPGGMCLVARMDFVVGEREGEAIEMCWPLQVVQSILEQLERHQSAEGIVKSERSEARRRLLDVSVELKLGYPPLGLTPADLLALQPGDVIPLAGGGHEHPETLELSVGDEVVGTGLLVDTGSRLACTVLTKKETNDEQ